MPDKRDPSPSIRRAQRVLLMVHELHKLGYQLLRIVPGESPSGAYWRCSITSIDNISRDHGALFKDGINVFTSAYQDKEAKNKIHLVYEDQKIATYSSSMSNEYFGWKDAKYDTARQLAAKFAERYPSIVEKAKGRDWEYAGWYVEMLGYADKGHLPLCYHAAPFMGEPVPSKGEMLPADLSPPPLPK